MTIPVNDEQQEDPLDRATQAEAPVSHPDYNQVFITGGEAQHLLDAAAARDAQAEIEAE